MNYFPSSDSMDDDEDADEPDENDEEFQNDPCYASIQDIQNETAPEPNELRRFSVYLNDSIDGELYSYCQIAIQVKSCSWYHWHYITLGF